jgi:hypothetical protein
MPAMFAWRYLDEDGEELGSSERFPDTEAAESWMGESWSDLRDRGVEEVVLVDEERDQRLYRMGLFEATV